MMDIQDILDESAILEMKALAAYQEKRQALDEFNKQHKHEREKNVIADDNVSLLIRHWYTDSVILFVEQRECLSCGNMSEMPESDMMVKSINYQRNITQITPRPIGLIPPHIQREIIYHEGKPTQGCTHCFTGLIDSNQLDLFNARTEYPIHSEYPATIVETHYDLEEL